MKLNEAKFIAEIRRLAQDIRDGSGIEQAKTKADGIISICNILDVDLPTIFIPPADKDAKLQPIDFQADSVFIKAQEEQHGGDSK